VPRLRSLQDWGAEQLCTRGSHGGGQLCTRGSQLSYCAARSSSRHCGHKSTKAMHPIVSVVISNVFPLCLMCFIASSPYLGLMDGSRAITPNSTNRIITTH
jgi:hypothetical protein